MWKLLRPAGSAACSDPTFSGSHPLLTFLALSFSRSPAFSWHLQWPSVFLLIWSALSHQRLSFNDPGNWSVGQCQTQPEKHEHTLSQNDLGSWPGDHDSDWYCVSFTSNELVCAFCTSQSELVFLPDVLQNKMPWWLDSFVSKNECLHPAVAVLQEIKTMHHGSLVGTTGTTVKGPGLDIKIFKEFSWSWCFGFSSYSPKSLKWELERLIGTKMM